MKRIQFIQKMSMYVLLYIVTGAIVASLFILKPDGNNTMPILRTVIIVFATILLAKYFIYMSVSPWYDVVMKLKMLNTRQNANTTYEPRVSVIVPAWNEEVGLVNTVKTILNSTYKNIEVVVVNDGSTDDSHKAMNDFMDTYDNRTVFNTCNINVVYSYKLNAGKGTALNSGIKLSTGDIIVSVDADCALLPDTVGNFVKYFRDPKVMAAVGNVKIGNTDHVLGTLQYLEFLFSFYFKKADSIFNTIYIIGGAAGAFRREVFDSVGMYNAKNITEDIEMSIRVQDAGMRIVYAADAVVYTEGATSFKSLQSQRLRWKRGRFQTFHNHRNLFFSTQSRHNKLLTWIILPMALLGETQLFMEMFFLSFLYIYSFFSRDFSSFIPGILVVSSMFFVQILQDRSVKKIPLYFLAPIGWLLFYISTYIEYNALIKSIWGIIAKKKPIWQKWERTGVLGKAPTMTVMP